MWARFSAHADDVLGGRPLLAVDHVELDPLTLGERAEALRLDGGEVDEAVAVAVFRRDEAEALGVVEPLHGSDGAHCGTPGGLIVSGTGKTPPADRRTSPRGARPCGNRAVT